MDKISFIFKELKKLYPNDFIGSNISKDPFHVLISTVLSHQTRDERTIMAAKNLFSKYPDAFSLAKAKVDDVRKLIKPVGMYNVKAKRIIQISRILVEKYNGEVPRNYEEVISLPGVGRKTANILFSFAYDSNKHIAVDTHVHKIANRLELVNTKTPDQTEQELYKIIPRSEWKNVNTLFVQHGQQICKARPLCSKCPLTKYCKYYKTVIKPYNYLKKD
jgi:endonuclease-3